MISGEPRRCRQPGVQSAHTGYRLKLATRVLKINDNKQHRVIHVQPPLPRRPEARRGIPQPAPAPRRTQTLPGLVATADTDPLRRRSGTAVPLSGLDGYRLISGRRPAQPDFFFDSPFSGLTAPRSEEHTFELQSRPHLVCRLL